MGSRSEGHMHTTVKPGEPDREHYSRPPPHPPTWLPVGPARAESFPLEDTDAGRCPVRRQFGQTSTMEWEGITGDLLSIARSSFACCRPAKISVALHLPAAGQQQPTPWPSHMPILMLCMIWKIAGKGKKTDSSDTRQPNAGKPAHPVPGFC